MNMRVSKPVMVGADRADPVSPPVGAGDRLAQARVVAVADGVAAMLFDTPGGQRRGGGRLGGDLAGRALPRPLVSTRLPLRSGGLRHVLLIGQAAERLAATPCRLALGSAPVAALDPGWLQSPLVEPFELVDGLVEDGRRRLLRMLLTTAGSLFGGGRTPGYGAAALRLAGLLDAPELRPAAVCAVGASGRLMSYRLPAGVAIPEIEALVAVAEDRVARIPRVAAHVERLARGMLLHVFAPWAWADALVALGAAPLILRCPAEAGPKPLAPWFARRSEATRGWLEDLVEAAAGSDPAARALRVELRHVDADPPELALRHLSVTARGVLALGDLVDPHRLVAAVRVETGDEAQDLDASASPGGRVTVGGFLDFARPVRPGAACSLRLVYGSGRVRTVATARPDAFSGAIPAAFGSLDPAAAAPALAAARLSLRRRAPTPVIEAIGPQPPRPALSLIVPAGPDPDPLRALAAALFAEPGSAAVDLVCHAGAAQAGAVRRLLGECRSVFGLGWRLMILPDDADASERLGAALAAARGPGALVLGAGVLPAKPGWLPVWTDALRRRRSAAVLGGVLLSHDGAVVDAGGALSVGAAGAPATLDRRWAGLPASALPGRPAATDLVTAGCVCLNRKAIAALCASDARYPEPDVLLLDLAHRLRRAAKTLTNARFVRFREPGADPLAAATDAQAIAALRRRPSSEGAA